MTVCLILRPTTNSLVKLCNLTEASDGSPPEMAALGIMALLRQHACEEVDHKEHSVALMTSPNVLAVMAPRSCATAWSRTP